MSEAINDIQNEEYGASINAGIDRSNDVVGMSRRLYLVVLLRVGPNLAGEPVRELDLNYGVPSAYSSFESAKLCAMRISTYLRENYDLHEEFEDTFLFTFRIQIMEMNVLLSISDEEMIAPIVLESPVVHYWCYNARDMLLWEYPDRGILQTSGESFLFEGRFQLGDLVYMQPQGLVPESMTVSGELGVVSEVPISKEAWADLGRVVQEWQPLYVVDFVDHEGLLDRFTVPESVLTYPREGCPRELFFLEVWSRFLRGELNFPAGLENQVRERKVQLRRIRRFDFATKSILF